MACCQATSFDSAAGARYRCLTAALTVASRIVFVDSAANFFFNGHQLFKSVFRCCGKPVPRADVRGRRRREQDQNLVKTLRKHSLLHSRCWNQLYLMCYSLLVHKRRYLSRAASRRAPQNLRQAFAIFPMFLEQLPDSAQYT